MDTSRNWNAWLVCLAFASVHASAQVFSHKQRGEHFEATVTADRIVVKERYKGATTVHGDLTCPLGSGVRASLLAESESKLCLTFSTDECEYTRYQNGNAIHKDELATARLPKMCIALANAKDAQRLVTLVNAGPQSTGHGEAAALELTLPPTATGTATAEAAPADVPRRVSTKAPAAQHAQAPSGSTQSVEVRTQTYSSSQNGAPRANGTKHAQRVTPVALFIHVRNPAQRAQAERLVKPLAAQGIRVTGIRMTGKGPAETDLRYFYNGDAEDTTQVVRVLRKLGVPDVRVKRITGLERRATPRQYELWLAPPEEPVRPPPRSRPQRAGFVRG
jgi:hypothetical protein